LKGDYYKTYKTINMFDPTNSRYRYLASKGTGLYRRFIRDDEELQTVGLVYQDNKTPAHGNIWGIRTEMESKKGRNIKKGPK
jgi:hypothetical protein